MCEKNEITQKTETEKKDEAEAFVTKAMGVGCALFLATPLIAVLVFAIVMLF